LNIEQGCIDPFCLRKHHGLPQGPHRPDHLNAHPSKDLIDLLRRVEFVFDDQDSPWCCNRGE